MTALRLVSVLLALCIFLVEVQSQPPTFNPDHPGLPGTCDDLNHCSRSPQPGGRPPTHGQHNPDADPKIGGAARG